MRKRVPVRTDRWGTGIRRDVREAIDRVWPNGVVDMSFDPDESYFSPLHPKLSRALGRIRNARLVYEHDADGGPVWWEESDPEEDPPDEVERERSYHTFFVSPEGEGFTFETEAEGITEPECMTADFAEAGWGEDPPVGQISGSGRTGWIAAVSLLAPFAVIEVGDMVAFEDGSTTEPEIESYGQTADGQLVDPEEIFREVHGAQASKILVSLRAKIAGIFEGFGITVLPAGEWRKPAPWLRGAEETLIGVNGKPIRVLDAFFFESL
jgi:hypothetical protein